MSPPSRPARAVRPEFLYLLCGAAALAALVTLLPTADDRMYARWGRLEDSYAAEGCAALATPERRAEFVSLAREMQEHSAMRRVQALAEFAGKCPPLPPETSRELLKIVFYDFLSWSTRFPQWKLDVLERNRGVLSAPASPEEDFAALTRSAPVDFVFRSPRARARLWLKGSWNASGELDSLGGWRDVELSNAGGGTWTKRVVLAKTVSNNVYHAVVRTRPWPEGETVGRAVFRVDGPARVELSPQEPGPRLEKPARGPKTAEIGTALLGIDGATWRVVLPLVYAGRLPHFRRLLDEGAVADLTSTDPGHFGSLVNIYSAVTGKLPFRHGAGRESNYLKPSGGRRASPLWQIVSDRHEKPLAVSMWDTFPPDTIRGALVSEAFFALDIRRQKGVKELALSRDVEVFAERFGVTADNIRAAFRLLGWIDGTIATTEPVSLEDRLRAERRVPADITDLASLTRHLDAEVLSVVEELTAAERFDLASVYLSEIDNASHVDWGEFEPSVFSFKKTIRDGQVKAAVAKLPSGQGRLEAAYEDADRVLGLLMDRAEHVVVYSDHGFGSALTDYLYLQFRVDAFLADFGRSSGSALPEGSEISGRSKDFRLWLPRTPAGDEYARRLTEHLRAARYLPHGSPMFSEIETQVRSGRLSLHFVQEQPKPIFINGVSVGGRGRSVMDFFELSTLQGVHQSNGLLALWGPRIRRARLPPAYEPDVAPTVLYLLGLPVARDMDGRALVAALRDGETERHPVGAVDGYGDREGLWLRIARAVRWRLLAAHVWTWIRSGYAASA